MSEHLAAAEQIRARLRRNFSQAVAAKNDAVDADFVYHKGRVDAIAQSYAEVFNLGWGDAMNTLSKGLATDDN